MHYIVVVACAVCCGVCRVLCAVSRVLSYAVLRVALAQDQDRIVSVYDWSKMVKNRKNNRSDSIFLLI